MDIQEIVEEYLKANGFDGLYNDDMECGCLVEDIMPCGSPCQRSCKPGMKVPCTCGAKCEWHVTDLAFRCKRCNALLRFPGQLTEEDTVLCMECQTEHRCVDFSKNIWEKVGD